MLCSVSCFYAFFFNNVVSFIKMLATINMPKVQDPFGVSLLHPALIIQGYNQNYMKYNILLLLKMHTFEVFYFLLFF